MFDEKKEILNKIEDLINKRKTELIRKYPHIHEIEDGIIIRFFTDWDDCDFNNGVKYKKILNKNNPNDLTIFHFIPKGTVLPLKKREYINCVSCLSGKIEIKMCGNVFTLSAFNKICINDDFEGVALDDTYVITSNSNKSPLT